MFDTFFLQISDSFIPQILAIIGAVIGIAIGYKKFDAFGTKQKQRNSSPLQILKERYAKGEISDEEFDRMKKKLTE